jgi:hypothetical protein
LSEVDRSDGIDAKEAEAIARAYFEDEYGMCGGPGDVTRKKRLWVFKVFFGLGGRELKDTIKVDAKTGGVWSEGGPRYRDLEAFRDREKAARTPEARQRRAAVQRGVAADGAARHH